MAVYKEKAYKTKLQLAFIIIVIIGLFLGIGAYNSFKKEADINNVNLLSNLTNRDDRTLQYATEIIRDINDASVENKDNRSAIYYSVCFNKEDLLGQLSQKGARYTKDDLFKAAECNAGQSVKFIKNAGVTLTNKELIEIVCRSTDGANLASLKSLLEKKVELGQARCGLVALIESAIRLNDSKKIEIIKTLMEKGGQDFRDYAINEIELLSLAVENNELQIVSYLLDFGKDNALNLVSDAVVNKSLELSDSMLKLLLDRAISSNKIIYDRPLLERVIEKNDYGKLTLLIDSGAIITAESYILAVNTGKEEFVEVIENTLSKQKPVFSASDIIKLYNESCKTNSSSMIDFLIKQGYDIAARAPSANNKQYANCDTSKFSHIITKDVIKRTKLHEASIQGDIDLVKSIISQGININSKDKDGDTALLKATEKGQLNVIKYLLKNGADIKAQGKNNEVVLNRLASKSHTIGPNLAEITQLLLDNSAEIESVDHNGNTPLLSSTWHLAHLGLTEMLLNNQANIEVRDRIENTPLFYAVSYGNTELVKLLLAKGAKVNVYNRVDSSPISISLSNRSMDITKLLLEAGAEIKGSLHVAAYQGDIDTVQYLLKKGASVQDTNTLGDTPLIVALRMGHMALVKILLEIDANINIKNKQEETALTVASSNNYLDIMKQLLSKGADINVKTEGDSLLHRAVEINNIPLIQFLVDNKINTELLDNDGKPALIKIVNQRDVSGLDILLGSDLDVNIQDKEGNTALLYAVVNKNVQVVKALVERGATISIANSSGESPDVIAKHYDLKKIIDVFNGSKAE